MFTSKYSVMVVYSNRVGNPKNMGLYIEGSGTFVKTTDTTFQSGTIYYISIGEYATEITYEYNKLWSSDSGRNLAGTQSGTLVGIFPKIVVQYRALLKEELETLVPILDSSNQTVKYYDANKKAMTTMTTYTGDYKIVNKDIVSGNDKNEGFSCSFIPVRKRV